MTTRTVWTEMTRRAGKPGRDQQSRTAYYRIAVEAQDDGRHQVSTWYYNGHAPQPWINGLTTTIQTVSGHLVEAVQTTRFFIRKKVKEGYRPAAGDSELLDYAKGCVQGLAEQELRQEAEQKEKARKHKETQERLNAATQSLRAGQDCHGLVCRM